jgi:hypothetical protein
LSKAAAAPEVCKRVMLNTYDTTSTWRSWMLDPFGVLVPRLTARCWCCGGVVAVEEGQHRVKHAPRLTTKPDKMRYYLKLHRRYLGHDPHGFESQFSSTLVQDDLVAEMVEDQACGRGGGLVWRSNHPNKVEHQMKRCYLHMMLPVAWTPCNLVVALP